MNNNKITVRVYGIFINKNNELLLSDEFHSNMKITKFPGGGLEFGEGTIDCLKREVKEELDNEISDIKHFYTTDFFQSSLLNNNYQVISIYYLAKLMHKNIKKLSAKPFNFKDLIDGSQSVRYVPIHQLSENDFTFPIDKHVFLLLKNKLLS